MDCPICNSQNIEIGTIVMDGKDFSATIHYAACHALLADNPNWGGGYDCEFFIVRESEEVLLAELKRLTMRAADRACGCGKFTWQGETEFIRDPLCDEHSPRR